MRICIHSFGPIYKYVFDLEKDFHLIVGENSVGKSYAITIVYLILKSFLSVEPRFFFSSYYSEPLEEDEEHRNSLSFLTSVTEDNNDKSVTREFELGLKKLLQSVYLPRLQASIDGTFDSDSVLINQHSQEDFRIDIETSHSTITLSLSKKRISIGDVKVHRHYIVRAVKTNRHPYNSAQSRIIYHNVNSPEHVTGQFFNENVRILMTVADEVFKRASTIHYLPASRSGLYQALSAFGQIVAELSKSRAFLTRRIDLPNISEPLSDYFLKLSSITVQSRRFADTRLDEIAKKIEERILGGKVEFDSKTKRLMFRPDGTSLRLDLSVTSSMVSELSPIVSYLRHILTEPTRRSVGSRRRETALGSMLIIEEPEAHLHPKVQVQLLENFAALTKLGVKVVITSHSNYIFSKASNMIISKHLPAEKVAATLFAWTSSGSVGKALNIDEYGIDDENFLETSEVLFAEKTEALSTDD